MRIHISWNDARWSFEHETKMGSSDQNGSQALEKADVPVSISLSPDKVRWLFPGGSVAVHFSVTPE